MYEVEAAGGLLMRTEMTAAAVAAEPPHTSEMSVDAALVAAVRAGDRDAFGRLYAAHSRMVHGILLARVPYGEVDDLVQDVFLVAFRKIDALRDAALFGPWLAMITRNRAMDFHRHTRDTTELTDDIPASNTSAPEADATEALEIIRRLPEAYREPLILRFVEGMTGPEIALRTGLAPASVRVNIHRGMKLLRERLGTTGAKERESL